MASFAGISFDLEGNDGTFFDLMGLGIDGPPELSLTILLYSRADALAFYRMRTRATPRQALQTFTGRVVIHAGPGPGTLLLPTGEDFALQSYSALLTDMQLERHEFSPALYRASCRFIILSDPTL